MSSKTKRKLEIPAIESTNEMCIESLPPDLFEKWGEVKDALSTTRKALKPGIMNANSIKSINREVKFRGKRKDNFEWAYGSLTIEYDGTCHINYWVDKLLEPENNYREPVHEMVEVIPETVGQFTTHERGFFVGDIVNYVTGHPSRHVNAVVEFGEYETYTHFNKEEGDVENHTGFYINDGKAKIPLGSLWIEKIGNIHDSPELLTPLKEGVLNMNIDPNAKTEGEVNEGAAQPAEAAQESASQDQAMEATKEEGTEG